MEKNIFEHQYPFSFAWSGGRFLIINNEQQIVDFGDGGLSHGGYSENYRDEFKHNILGKIKADNTRFIFKDHNVEFDFSRLKNCNFLDRNKAKGKPRYKPTVIFHLERYSNKRKLNHDN